LDLAAMRRRRIVRCRADEFALRNRAAVEMHEAFRVAFEPGDALTGCEVVLRDRAVIDRIDGLPVGGDALPGFRCIQAPLGHQKDSRLALRGGAAMEGRQPACAGKKRPKSRSPGVVPAHELPVARYCYRHVLVWGR